jgi:hypothetical protein
MLICLFFKFLYRMDGRSQAVTFYRGNTINHTTFGFSGIRQGAQIVLSPSHFAESKADLAKKEIAPLDGLRLSNFILTQPALRLDSIADVDVRERLAATLVLSEDARRFALARALASTAHEFSSLSDLGFDLMAMFGAYWIAYSTY